jgi:hypothetical protein
MLDLEDELRSVLHDRSDALRASDDLDARIVGRVRTKVRARRLTTALVSLAVIAGAAAVTTGVVRHNDRGPTLTVIPGPANEPGQHAGLAVEPGRWATITEPPMTGAFASVSTGRELVVAFQQSRVRFATYDARTDAWGAVPDPPIEIQEPFTDSSTFVWTGSTVLVWGYENHGSSTFSGHHRLLAYDPAAKQWTRLADPPIAPLIQAHPVWTGHELMVWGGNFNGENALAQGAAYDPTTDHWRAIASAPLSTRENPMIVWTGHEMIVWGGLSNGKATAADRLEGAAYDPTTDTWRELPASGVPAMELASTAWTGSEMIVFGAGVGAFAAADVGAAYNPLTNRWRDIAATPLSPREQMASAWTGHELVVWGGIAFGGGRQTRNDGAAYDPATDTWHVLADAPLESRWGSTMAWIDGLIVVAGGYGPSGAGLSSEPAATGAAAYRP